VRVKLLTSWDRLHSSYWFVPSLMTVAAVAFAIIVLCIDRSAEFAWLEAWGFMYLNRPDGARALLSTVAGSMIGVAGTTFSITLAVLSLTSSQFGPRLLRNFMRDTGNQIVLGTFVATFTYCLLVLRTIHAADEDGGAAFVPHLAVTFSILFALLGLAVFIYFIHHTAESIQASSIVTRVGNELEALLKKHYPEKRGPPTPSLEPALPPAEAAQTVCARRSGYLQTVDEEGLLGFAKAQGVTVQLLHPPGTFLVEGQPLARLWPPGKVSEEGDEALRQKITLGAHRTTVQDFDFLFDQLTEVALRALSPGVNDAVTATQCLDRLSQGFHTLAWRELGPPYRTDEAGTPRLLLPALDFGELVGNTLGPIRRFSGDNMLVSLHLLDTIGVLLSTTDEASLRRALLHEAHLVRETARPVLIEEDFKRLTARYREVTSAPARAAPSVPG